MSVIAKLSGKVAGKLATVGGPRVQLAAARINKFSPQILTGVGIVGSIGGTVLVARATLKLEALVRHHEQGLEVVRLKWVNGEYASDGERSRDVIRLYVQFCLELGKLYGPGASLLLASYISIAAGQGIAQKRQVALVAAVKSAESALQAYRARVIEAIGAEKEAEIRYGIQTETVEDANGKKTKVKTFDRTKFTGYTREFDESNKNWVKGARELNFLFLKNVQNWVNDRLEARGYVYLNEVLDLLGLPEEPSGQVVGWLHKSFDNGDGYIDFGWDNAVNDITKRDFLDGNVDFILLDFNVDGEINSKL